MAGKRKYVSGSGAYNTRSRAKRSKSTYTPKRKKRSNPRTTYNPVSAGSAAVYLNPFSVATTNPKIPDGKTKLSVGIRFQQVAEYQNDTSGTIDIVMFPGFSNGIFVKSASTNSFGTDRNNTMPYARQVNATLGFADSTTYYMNSGLLAPAQDTRLGVTSLADPAEVYKCSTGIGEGLTGWRLVSQGLRVTLTNNSDENDGWWESVRFNPNVNEDFKFHCNNVNQSNDVFFKADATPRFESAPGKQNFFDPIMYPRQVQGGSLVENQTYVSGKLRDIHRYVWQLYPISEGHDYTKVASNPEDPIDFVRLDHGPTEVFQKNIFDVNPNTNYLEVSSMLSESNQLITNDAGASLTLVGREKWQDLCKPHYDESFDCIFIRIHGRTNTGQNQNSAQPTRIMLHTVSNQEHVYDDGVLNHKFMNQAMHTPAFDRINAQIVSRPHLACHKR